jgi:hypothetical protein
VVVVDEVPEIGIYLEIEGLSPEVNPLTRKLVDLGCVAESRNYREVVIAQARLDGIPQPVRGATFDDGYFFGE